MWLCTIIRNLKLFYVASGSAFIFFRNWSFITCTCRGHKVSVTNSRNTYKDLWRPSELKGSKHSRGNILSRAMDPGGFLFFLPSWLSLIVIGLLTVYFVKCLFPRPKIDVQGKYVLITGCDSGFGRATAIQLDKMGVCVLATCLTKKGEQSLKSVASDKLKTFQMDVTNSQQIKDVHEEVTKLISPGRCERSIGSNTERTLQILG